MVQWKDVDESNGIVRQSDQPIYAKSNFLILPIGPVKFYLTVCLMVLFIVFKFYKKTLQANSGEPDQTQHNTVSTLGLKFAYVPKKYTEINITAFVHLGKTVFKIDALGRYIGLYTLKILVLRRKKS